MINALALHIFICCTFFPREPRLCTFTLLTVFFPAVTAQWRDPSPGTGRGMLHPKAMLLVLVSIMGQDLVFGLAGAWGPSLPVHPQTPLACPFLGSSLCSPPPASMELGTPCPHPLPFLPSLSPLCPPPLPGPLQCPDLGTAGMVQRC